MFYLFWLLCRSFLAHLVAPRAPDGMPAPTTTRISPWMRLDDVLPSPTTMMTLPLTTLMTTLVHAPQRPRIYGPPPSQATQYLPHWDRYQLPPTTASAHHKSVYYALGFNIGHHLGMGGSTKGKTNDNDNDDGGGQGSHALMSDPGIVLEKYAGEGGCG